MPNAPTFPNPASVHDGLAKAAVGRPTKLEPERVEKMLALIRAGTYIETAVLAAGITPRAFRAWMYRGANSESGKFRRFSDAVFAAKAEAESTAQLHLRNAMQGIPTKRDEKGRITVPGVPPQWFAAAWYLERINPKVYGKQHRQVIEQTLTTVMKVIEGQVEPDVFDRILAAVARELGGAGAGAEDSAQPRLGAGSAVVDSDGEPGLREPDSPDADS